MEKPPQTLQQWREWLKSVSYEIPPAFAIPMLKVMHDGTSNDGKTRPHLKR